MKIKIFIVSLIFIYSVILGNGYGFIPLAQEEMDKIPYAIDGDENNLVFPVNPNSGTPVTAIDLTEEPAFT